ncbi:hypothetical protein M080_5023, partial [Bacteroides fragilis str. 3397 T10]
MVHRPAVQYWRRNITSPPALLPEAPCELFVLSFDSQIVTCCKNKRS